MRTIEERLVDLERMARALSLNNILFHVANLEVRVAQLEGGQRLGPQPLTPAEEAEQFEKRRKIFADTMAKSHGPHDVTCRCDVCALARADNQLVATILHCLVLSGCVDDTVRAQERARVQIARGVVKWKDNK